MELVLSNAYDYLAWQGSPLPQVQLERYLALNLTRQPNYTATLKDIKYSEEFGPIASSAKVASRTELAAFIA